MTSPIVKKIRRKKKKSMSMSNANDAENCMNAANMPLTMCKTNSKGLAVATPAHKRMYRELGGSKTPNAAIDANCSDESCKICKKEFGVLRFKYSCDKCSSNVCSKHSMVFELRNMGASPQNNWIASGPESTRLCDKCRKGGSRKGRIGHQRKLSKLDVETKMDVEMTDTTPRKQNTRQPTESTDDETIAELMSQDILQNTGAAAIAHTTEPAPDAMDMFAETEEKAKAGEEAAEAEPLQTSSSLTHSLVDALFGVAPTSPLFHQNEMLFTPPQSPEIQNSSAILDGEADAEVTPPHSPEIQNSSVILDGEADAEVGEEYQMNEEPDADLVDAKNVLETQVQCLRGELSLLQSAVEQYKREAEKWENHNVLHMSNNETKNNISVNAAAIEELACAPLSCSAPFSMFQLWRVLVCKQPTSAELE